VRAAEMYCEEFRLMPLVARDPSFPPVAKSTLIWPSLVGSGKFDTPCERMQSTYARAALYFEAVLPPLPAVCDDDVWVVVVVEPTLATPGGEPLPPHAAVRRPRPRSTNAKAPGRPSRR
jgi:hypothetical protein